MVDMSNDAEVAIVRDGDVTDSAFDPSCGGFGGTAEESGGGERSGYRLTG